MKLAFCQVSGRQKADLGSVVVEQFSPDNQTLVIVNKNNESLPISITFYYSFVDEQVKKL